MTVYFHGSFGLNREYMAGVLAASLKNPGASGDEIAEPYGYKAPFTGRYKSWLHKTGITSKGRKVRLTPMGKVVWENDPRLQSITTQWLMHHELSTDPERAEAWHYFVHEFAPKHTSFTVSDLENGLAMKLMPHHPEHFGMGSSMIKVIARKIIQCYTQPEALGELGLVSSSGGKSYKIQRVQQAGPWDSSEALEAAY
jgi:hypothetical protein